MCIKILPSLYIIYIIVCIVEALTNTINYKAIKFMVTKFKRKSLLPKSKPVWRKILSIHYMTIDKK